MYRILHSQQGHAEWQADYLYTYLNILQDILNQFKRSTFRVVWNFHDTSTTLFTFLQLPACGIAGICSSDLGSIGYHWAVIPLTILYLLAAAWRSLIPVVARIRSSDLQSIGYHWAVIRPTFLHLPTVAWHHWQQGSPAVIWDRLLCTWHWAIMYLSANGWQVWTLLVLSAAVDFRVLFNLCTGAYEHLTCY